MFHWTGEWLEGSPEKTGVLVMSGWSSVGFIVSSRSFSSRWPRSLPVGVCYLHLNAFFASSLLMRFVGLNTE